MILYIHSLVCHIVIHIYLQKIQSFTKSKIGDTGAIGPEGPVITLTANGQSFTSTDGTLDGSQSDITFTAVLQNIGSIPVFSILNLKVLLILL
jgi:hypothetical protein